MTSDTATNDWLNEAAEADQSSKGKLNDTEIQRLVSLSRDASYRRSEHVPVKTIEAFEPKSLVSIAMAAQRRRENEMRTAVAAGAVLADDNETTQGDSSQTEVIPEVGSAEAELSALQSVESDTATTPVTGPAPGEQGEAAADDISDTTDETASSISNASDNSAVSEVMAPNLDFEAGQTAGLEEGRKIGHQEGHAAGLEEGMAAGRAEASAQLERAIQAFEIATEKLGALTEIDSADLAASINDAIMALASERAGQAITDLPAAFADRIEALLASVHTVVGEPLIRLNASDLASIKPLVETRERLKKCRFVVDQSLVSGDLKVSVGSIGIDDVLTPRAPVDRTHLDHPSAEADLKSDPEPDSEPVLEPDHTAENSPLDDRPDAEGQTDV